MGDEQFQSQVGSKPQEVSWRPVGQLKVEGSRLYIGDSWAIGVESVAVPVTPGVYDIDAQFFLYGTDERVAVLRGRLQGSSPDGSTQVGEFSVDVASAGVIDADAVDRWSAADPQGYEAWQRGFSESGHSDLPGFHPCPAIGSSMVFTSTGFGDGSYKALSLLEGDKHVGFEARFLEDGQRYFVGGGISRIEPLLHLPPKAGAFRRYLMVAAAVGLAIVGFVVAVTLGILGYVSLKIAQLLKAISSRK